MESENSINWLRYFGNQDPQDKTAIEIQFKVFAECLKLSLGVTEFKSYNSLEIMMEILWLIFGLSIFGYGIGNISAYLNQANKWENDYNEKLNQFKELMSLHNNESLNELITRDLDKYYENILINEFDQQSTIVSNNVKNMLETTIQQNFMNSHKVLAELNIKAIRLLKYSKINSDQYIIRSGEVINNVQFVIRGGIKMLNTNLSVLNEFSEGEILGIPQFKEQFLNKYMVDLSSLEEDQSCNNKLNIVGKQMKELLLKKLREKAQNFNFVHKQIEIEANWYAVSSTNDTSQYEVHYDTLEELFRCDIDSLKQILDSSVTQLQLIDDNDHEIYNKMQQEFDLNDSCAIMIKKTGQFQDVNYETQQNPNFAKWKEQWFDYNIQDMMQNAHGVKVVNLDDIHLNDSYKLEVSTDEKYTIVVNKIYDGKVIQHNRNDIYYYKLKKSMVNVKIIYFEVI